MSFRDAEASDATLNGVATILRAALERPDYERNPHQVYDSMDSDPLIGALPEIEKPASRIQLLRRVSGLRADPSEILEKVVLFCRENLQQGPVRPPESASTFGRVQSFGSIVNAIAGPSSGLSLRKAEALLRDAVADSTNSAAKLAKQKSDLAGKRLSRYQMWCYPPADVRNPFREIGTTRADAVNMLGLGYYAYDEPGAQLVRWVHALHPGNFAHQPTAWDAGATPRNVDWRPGGKTFQIERDDFGVPEFVHDPIRGEHLTAPIETLS